MLTKMIIINSITVVDKTTLNTEIFTLFLPKNTSLISCLKSCHEEFDKPLRFSVFFMNAYWYF